MYKMHVATGMRDQTFARRDDIQDVDDDDITFEDLLGDEPEGTPPASFSQLLADGFPRNGGLTALDAIARLPDPGKRLAALQRGYLQLLQKQRRTD
jgi:hypothetical protein